MTLQPSSGAAPSETQVAIWRAAWLRVPRAQIDFRPADDSLTVIFLDVMPTVGSQELPRPFDSSPATFTAGFHVVDGEAVMTALGLTVSTGWFIPSGTSGQEAPSLLLGPTVTRAVGRVIEQAEPVMGLVVDLTQEQASSLMAVWTAFIKPAAG